jgi:hypothetical protein
VSREAIDAIEELVAAVPELGDVWRRHRQQYGDPLPHLFFGDVARFAIAVADGEDEELFARFAAAVERLAASDEDAVENLVLVSFVETVEWDDRGDVLDRLGNAAGPALCGRIREFRDWDEGFRRSGGGEP